MTIYLQHCASVNQSSDDPNQNVTCYNSHIVTTTTFSFKVQKSENVTKIQYIDNQYRLAKIISNISNRNSIDT